MLVEFILTDGSRYTIDFSLVCVVGRKAWKNIRNEFSDEAKQVTTITTVGGAEIHISGTQYEEVVKRWRQILDISSESS